MWRGQRALTGSSSRAGCSSGAAAIVAVPAAMVVAIMTMVVVVVLPAPVQQLALMTVACTGKHDVTSGLCTLLTADEPGHLVLLGVTVC